MKDDYRVFDSDMHVLEPGSLGALHRSCLSPSRAAGHDADTDGRRRDGGRRRRVHAVGADCTRELPGWARPVRRRHRARLRRPRPAGGDGPRGHRRHGPLSSRGLFVHSISDLDPAFSEAIARAYNDWLADFCRAGDPAGCMAPPCCPSTTSPRQSARPGARCATSASRPSSCDRTLRAAGSLASARVRSAVGRGPGSRRPGRIP